MCYGVCYRSGAFREACRRHGLKYTRTTPYTPRINGKAERFIQTALYANGRMPEPTTPQTSAPRTCPDGSIATTGTDHMVA